MHRVLSRDQIRSFDRIAIEDCHVPGVVLMENAGRGAAETIQSLITDETDHVLVVCGTGNNGGDGFVVARHLLSAGESVSVCLLGDPSKLRGDALVNHEAFVGLDGHVVIVDDEGSLPVLETELLRAGLVVDAIFGTGLDREIRGRFAQAIDRMNATAATRVALDLPSGLDANTGTVLGTAVVADTTITFGALKLGLLTPTGSRLAGDIHVAALGVSPAILDETGHVAEILIASRLQSMVERLRTQARIIEDAPVGIVVSDEGSVWAARLALRACRRTAPGPVRLLPSRKALGSVQDLAAEALIEPWDAKQGVKSLAKAWAGCGSLVFPSVDPNELGAVEKARASFEGLLVAAAAPTLGADRKSVV